MKFKPSKWTLFAHIPSFAQAFAGAQQKPQQVKRTSPPAIEREAQSDIMITIPSPRVSGFTDESILKMVGAAPPNTHPEKQQAAQLKKLGCVDQTTTTKERQNGANQIISKEQFAMEVYRLVKPLPIPIGDVKLAKRAVSIDNDAAIKHAAEVEKTTIIERVFVLTSKPSTPVSPLTPKKPADDTRPPVKINAIDGQYAEESDDISKLAGYGANYIDEGFEGAAFEERLWPIYVGTWKRTVHAKNKARAEALAALCGR